MFDQIDLSSLDDMNLGNSMDEDGCLDSTPGILLPEDFTSLNEDHFSSNVSDDVGYNSFNSSIETPDTYPWDSEDPDFFGVKNQLNTSTGSSAPIDLSQLENEISFKGDGYTQSEINSHISEAKHDIADAESDIRHHTYIANSKARMGEPHSFEDSQIRSAQSRLNEAKSDLNKWQHMKPSK